MKHINVVAIKDKGKFLSSTCYCNDPSKIYVALEKLFYLPNSARSIVTQGDFHYTDSGEFISFYRDMDYLWAQCCPVSHDNNDVMIDFAMSIGASAVFLYDGGRWVGRWRYSLEAPREIA